MRSKLKILFLITGLEVGGAEVLLRDMVFSLDQNFYDPVVLSLRPTGSIGQEIMAKGGRVISLNAYFKFNPLIFIKLLKVIFKEKPDIIHAHLFHADFLGRLARVFYRRGAYASTIHNVNMGGWLRGFLLKITRCIPDATIAVGEVIKAKALRLGWVAKKSTRVIYNGIDLGSFVGVNKFDTRKKLGLPPEEFIFICVGRLDRQKGYSVLVEATAKLNQSSQKFQVIVLGEGRERRFLEKQIAVVGASNIKLKGRADNVLDYLSVVDSFLMPSLWEGLPVALIEAMAVGLPTVATNVGGIKELVTDGKTGFLVEPPNSTALADKMKKMLFLTSAEREQMGRVARIAVQEKFSLQKMVNEHKKLYKDLIHGCKRNKTKDSLAG